MNMKDARDLDIHQVRADTIRKGDLILVSTTTMREYRFVLVERSFTDRGGTVRVTHEATEKGWTTAYPMEADVFAIRAPNG